MTRFIRHKLVPMGFIGLFLSLITVARADSVTFTDSWKDSAKSSGGSATVSSTDTGSFTISLTIPGLGSLTTTQLTSLVVSATFGDISLPQDFTNAPKTSINSISSSQTELNNSGQTVTVGTQTATISGSVVTIKGSLANPVNSAPFPIFADQFLGSNGPIVSQKLLTLSISGPLTYSLQKTIYITGTGSVTQDSQHDNLYSVQVSGTANFTPPTLTFINPGPHAEVTNNAVVTVYAMVKDSGKATNVEFSLNGTGFVPGTQLSSNVWTTVFILPLGFNYISAYAVDADGYASTTNTLAVQYVVTAPLIVNIVGKGTLKPNDNGMSLIVGNPYTMKATPARGFGFYYWDIVGITTTSFATLNFTMVSNMVINAIFKDITPPTLKVTSPTANQKLTGYLINVSGTASDNVGVTAVYVQINAGGWMTATGTNVWSLNNQSVTPGTNIVLVVAMDAAGNMSPTNEIKVIAPPDWAPDTLAGSTMDVSDPIMVSFEATNFSQTDITTNGDSGTGNYVYDKTDTNAAELSLTFESPPSLSNNIPQDILLTFTNLNRGVYTNVGSASTGTFSVTAALTGVLPASWSGHTITASHAGSTSKTTVTFARGNNDITISSPSNPNRTGTYVATEVSPVCALLMVTYTDQPDLGNISYLQVTFTSRSGGNYEVNTFDSGGNFLSGDTGFGTFTFR
jgi:hypothetical protein